MRANLLKCGRAVLWRWGRESLDRAIFGHHRSFMAYFRSHVLKVRMRMSGLPKQRVLIIEDNADANDSLAMLLEMFGLSVAQAFDGPGALKLAPEFDPQVVLCDVGLPGMDGYAVARALRALYTGRPLVIAALSGYSDVEDRSSSVEALFDRHFTKPIGHEQLESFFEPFIRGNGSPEIQNSPS